MGMLLKSRASFLKIRLHLIFQMHQAEVAMTDFTNLELQIYLEAIHIPKVKP